MNDIEVVDIADNTNKEVPDIKENVKEDIQEDVKQDIQEDVKQDIKEDVKQDIKEDVKQVPTAESGGTRRVPEHPSSDIKEDVKQDIKEKKKVRKDLKEKGTCPDCGMEMTQHSLRYTHKKYCKAKQISTEPVETVENKTLDKNEEEQAETLPPSPPKLQRAISRIADAVPMVQEPNDDQIAQYLLNKKKALMTKKKEKCLY